MKLLRAITVWTIALLISPAVLAKEEEGGTTRGLRGGAPEEDGEGDRVAAMMELMELYATEDGSFFDDRELKQEDDKW